MAANGNKKHGRTKKSAAQIRYTAERRWESNRVRRVSAEKAWQSLCKAAREAGATKAIGRAIRRIKRARAA